MHGGADGSGARIGNENTKRHGVYTDLRPLMWRMMELDGTVPPGTCRRLCGIELRRRIARARHRAELRRVAMLERIEARRQADAESSAGPAG
jgi:hypothetical protein